MVRISNTSFCVSTAVKPPIRVEHTQNSWMGIPIPEDKCELAVVSRNSVGNSTRPYTVLHIPSSSERKLNQIVFVSWVNSHTSVQSVHVIVINVIQARYCLSANRALTMFLTSSSMKVSASLACYNQIKHCNHF